MNILRINCAPSWLYLQDYTGMHSQQNIKFNNKDIKIGASDPRIKLLDMTVLEECGCRRVKLLLTYLFTYLLTPWSRILLEKLTGL
jgi:hypothetical protein